MKSKTYMHLIRITLVLVLLLILTPICVNAADTHTAQDELKPSFAWIDDDGSIAVYTHLYPWAVENNIPVTSAVATRRLTTPTTKHLNAEQMVEMYNSGWVTFASHTVNHTKLSTVTVEEIEKEVSTSKAVIESYGVPCEVMVYPYGAISDEGVEVVRRYLPYGFLAGGPIDSERVPTVNRINYTPMMTYRIMRIGILSAMDSNAIARIKGIIDKACETNGMIVFMSHVGATAGKTAEDDIATYTEIVEYIRQKGYDIEPVTTVCERFSNAVEHTYSQGACTVCDKGCPHNWQDGICSICDLTCPHKTYASGICVTCGEPEPNIAPTISVRYPALSFEDRIHINVLFDVANKGSASEENMGLITFNSKVNNGTIHDADNVIPGARFNSATGLFCVQTAGIPAKKLGDTVYFRVYIQRWTGEYIYSELLSYSPKDYAYSVINGNYPENMKALSVAVLDYGAAAQTYFNYNTQSLVNADLTPSQKALIQPYAPDMIDGIFPPESKKFGGFAKTSAGFSRIYPAVSFDGAFSIDCFCSIDQITSNKLTLYYWDQETYNRIGTLQSTNATGSAVMTGEDEFHGVISGIAAKNFDDTVYIAVIYRANGVRYSTGVLPYSIGAYCADRIANGSANIQAFASATAVYGYYAKTYFVA